MLEAVVKICIFFTVRLQRSGMPSNACANCSEDGPGILDVVQRKVTTIG